MSISIFHYFFKFKKKKKKKNPQTKILQNHLLKENKNIKGVKTLYGEKKGTTQHLIKSQVSIRNKQNKIRDSFFKFLEELVTLLNDLWVSGSNEKKIIHKKRKNLRTEKKRRKI